LVNKTDIEMLKIYKQISKEADEENQALRAENLSWVIDKKALEAKNEALMRHAIAHG